MSYLKYFCIFTFTFLSCTNFPKSALRVSTVENTKTELNKEIPIENKDKYSRQQYLYLSGIATNSEGIPLPHSVIYLRGDPFNKVVANSSGEFEIEIGKDATIYDGNKVSLIGKYEEGEIRLSAISDPIEPKKLSLAESKTILILLPAGSMTGSINLRNESEESENFEIVIPGTDFKALINKDGEFILDSFPAGEWALEAFFIKNKRKVALNRVEIISGKNVKSGFKILIPGWSEGEEITDNKQQGDGISVEENSSTNVATLTILFEDKDYRENYLLGTVEILDVSIESEIALYQVYWGTDNFEKVSIDPFLVSESAVDLSLQEAIGILNDATHLLIFGIDQEGFLKAKGQLKLRDNKKPLPPSSLEGQVGQNQISLLWDSIDEDVSNFLLLRKSLSSVDFTPSSSEKYLTNQLLDGQNSVAYFGDSTSFDDIGLLNDVEYHYALYSIDRDGNYSSYPLLFSGIPKDILAPVSGGVTAQHNPNQVAINWSNSETATGYLIVVSHSNPASFSPTSGTIYSTGLHGSDSIIYVGTDNSFLHNIEVLSKTYHYYIYAHDTFKNYSPALILKTSEYACKGLAGGFWSYVPGDPEYTENPFCVMKYEAKNVDGKPFSMPENNPWVNISQLTAEEKCQSLGDGFDLIDNSRWMTLTKNIANHPINWSGSEVGSGTLNRGHSDNSPSSACPASDDDNKAWLEGSCVPTTQSSQSFLEKRTHIISNGETVWDLGGNGREFTSDFQNTGKASPTGNSWYEYSEPVINGLSITVNDLIPPIAIDNNWNSANGIGKYFPGSNGSGGVISRGGHWLNGDKGGIFTARLDGSPSTGSNWIAFRCIFEAQ